MRRGEGEEEEEEEDEGRGVDEEEEVESEEGTRTVGNKKKEIMEMKQQQNKKNKKNKEQHRIIQVRNKYCSELGLKGRIFAPIGVWSQTLSAPVTVRTPKL